MARATPGSSLIWPGPATDVRIGTQFSRSLVVNFRKAAMPRINQFPALNPPFPITAPPLRTQPAKSMLGGRIEPVPGPRIESQPAPQSGPQFAAHVNISLSAALICVRNDEPLVLIIPNQPEPDVPGEDVAAGPLRLPSVPLDLSAPGGLDQGVRAKITAQTGIELGPVEQLGTFRDPDRPRSGTDEFRGSISISYLGVLDPQAAAATTGGQWVRCYDILPWEDWRNGRPDAVATVIEPLLRDWAGGPAARSASAPAIRRVFGLDGGIWDEAHILERHDLLHQAHLLGLAPPSLGLAMLPEHRRTLAMALARLRTKLKLWPVAFELMDQTFTLFELQRTVEAVQGTALHKQNFRRLVEATGMIEPVGGIRTKTGGRPAKLYRVRTEVIPQPPAVLTRGMSRRV
jgi:hypothetical protein